MAFNVSGLAAYVGNEKFPLIANLQVSSSTASVVSKQVGIKKSENLHFLATNAVFQANGCSTRSASGTATLTDKTITVADMQVNFDLCGKSLIGKWAEIELGMGAMGDRDIPASIESVFVDDLMAQIKEALEVADWQGDTSLTSGNSSFYNGWIKLIDAGSPVDGNTGSLTSITVSNIIAACQAMFLAQTKELQSKTNKSLFLPREWYNLYTVALVNANLYHYAGGDGETQKLFGTDIVIRPTDGLNGTNRMFLTYNDNLVIGMDGAEDADNIEVRLDPVSQKNVFFDVEFKRGTQVRYIGEVVEFTLA